MKKTLIAMAAIAAMGAASAEMTFYGKVDLGVSSTTGALSNMDVGTLVPYFADVTASLNSNNPKTPDTKKFPAKKADQGAVIKSGNYSGSRFGFTGSTDLGGGLKGSFMMETGFDAATGKGGNAETGAVEFGDRGASAALSGAFGTVSLGRQFSPYSAASWNEPLEYDGFSTLGAAWQSYGYHKEAYWHSKSVMYTTPTVNGLNASVMYANNGDAEASVLTDLDGKMSIARSASNYTSVGVNYATGPLTFAFGQETSKAKSPSPLDAGVTQTTAWQASVAYNAGVATVYLGYEAAKADARDGLSGKDTGWNIGANVGLGEGAALQLGYGTEKSTIDGSGGDASMADQTVTAMSAVFVKELNKSTRLYAGVTSTKVESKFLTTLGDLLPNLGLDNSQTTTTTAVGIRYSF